MSGTIRRVVGVDLPAFKVWDHDSGDEADAVEVHAFNPKEAAELYAELGRGDQDRHPCEIEVSVRDGQGRLWACTVHSEVEVTFRADNPWESEEDGCTAKKVQA